jgi:endonuclease I
VNTQKSNLGFVDSSGDYKKINQGWYPGDEWKGDVARMIFYLNIRYDEIINDIGTIELFQKWNIEDPVSDFERQRNSVIEQAQGNRNPFIDNPYLVTLVWGGEDAENIWE